MRHLARFRIPILAVAVLALAAPTAAHAASPLANLVDGSVTTSGTTCSWADATTSADPPAALTIDRTTVALTCDGSADLTLNNDPAVSFDDAAGTATVDTIDITGTSSGVTCTYEVKGATLNRDGDTRNYTGGPYTADLVDGGILCPSSATVDSASVSFH